jgi:urease accessory protein
MVEPAIAVSVIVLGIVVAAGLRLSAGLAMGVVGLFGLFHGHAHGNEGAGVGSFLQYSAGFVVATVLLHPTGLGLGQAVDRLQPAQASRARMMIGGTGTLAGAAFMLG